MPNSKLGDQFLLLGEQKEVYVGTLLESPGLDFDLVSIPIIRKGHGVVRILDKV